MPFPPAIFLNNNDAHEINVNPTTLRRAGVAYVDPVSLRLVIPNRDLQTGELGAAIDNGRFECLKENATDAFAVGDLLSYGTTGYIAGTDSLEVVEPSTPGQTHVLAELNRVSGGGGVTPAQVTQAITQQASRSIAYTAPAGATDVANTPPTLAELTAQDASITSLASLPAKSEITKTLSNGTEEVWRWDGATFSRVVEQTFGLATAVEAGTINTASTAATIAAQLQAAQTAAGQPVRFFALTADPTGGAGFIDGDVVLDAATFTAMTVGDVLNVTVSGGTDSNFLRFTDPVSGTTFQFINGEALKLRKYPSDNWRVE